MSTDAGQVEFLSQSVDYLGFLKQQLGDLLGITTLAHELIQNADDAKNEAGELSATRISFDVRDDALVVHNDAVFRDADFERLRHVAAGTKRSESGARTTGAFGVGFISVYQVTDRPEITSAGRHWTLRPDEADARRIAERRDPSVTQARGTTFRLPWALSTSVVRERLGVPPIRRGDIEEFTQGLSETLPRAILFLKAVKTVELRRNGERLLSVTRTTVGDDIFVASNGESTLWRIFTGNFGDDAARLRESYGSYIEENRQAVVRIAVPGTPLERGLLFATLPTEEVTGLPFHIDADFFPDSDRKHIAFGSALDHRSEWNRAAVRAATSTLAQNLQSLLQLFDKDHRTFWFMLDRLYRAHQASDERRPFGYAWPQLQSSLGANPVVFTESAKWCMPSEARLASFDEASVATLNALGLDTTHRDLRSYRTILALIHVPRISAADFRSALSRLGLVDAIASTDLLPSSLRSHDGVVRVWDAALSVLDSARTPESARSESATLADCSLALCMDGKLRPFSEAYRCSTETREMFGRLAPGLALLGDACDGHAISARLCPDFVAEAAADVLERLGDEALIHAWRSGLMRPVELLRWFRQQGIKSAAGADLRRKIAGLPIFPSGGALLPLTDLALPGNFVDPLGLSELVDLQSLPGLRDFLEELGATELTFRQYASSSVPRAFAAGRVEPGRNRRLVSLLAEHVGEIRDDLTVKRTLAGLPIVECEDGEFRQAREAYIRTEDVARILSRHAPYARSQGVGASVRELYLWLGVADRPRAGDVVSIVERLTMSQPTQASVESVTGLIDALARLWPRLSDTEKEAYGNLKSRPWLPAERDRTTWHRPTELFAVFNKPLFESQASFLDVPNRTQQSAAQLFEFLGVNRAPRPHHVIGHLRTCVERNVDPPAGLYDWLNNSAQEPDLRPLRGEHCLRLDGVYYRPDQVFWGDHPFGRFRKRLGEGFRTYSKLLSALDVRQTPGHADAIEVLKEISKDVGHRSLGADKDPVLQCWAVLSDAVTRRELDPDDIRNALGEVECVPNHQDLLYKPTWMFFEDRPDLASKFAELMRNNTIRRHERAWRAMQAAGVRPISEVITAELLEPEAAWEDPALRELVAARAALLRGITEGHTSEAAISLEAIRFVRADAVRVVWHINAVGQNRRTDPEIVSACLTQAGDTIYFTLDRGDYPWGALARELALALAPGVEVRMLSPGIMLLLSADDEQEAASQLGDLGIAAVDAFRANGARGAASIDTFDERAQADQDSPVGHPPGESSLADDTTSPTPDKAEHQAPSQMPPIEPLIGNAASSAAEQETFAKKLFEAQTHQPLRASDSPVLLPQGGPMTEESARRHTEESFSLGRAGARLPKIVTRWEPQEAARVLAEEFRQMTHGDYARRCQICGRTFQKRNGEPQTFVLHLVQPSAHRGTNHFGDLVSLCGWHYALVRDGQWAFVDPVTREAIEDLARLNQLLTGAEPRVDEQGGEYVCLAVRFWNVYEQWDAAPQNLDEEIRYSLPHWEYVRSLLTAEDDQS